MIGKRAAGTWEVFDRPLLIRDQEEGRERYTDETEAFFSYIFTQLT